MARQEKWKVVEADVDWRLRALHNFDCGLKASKFYFDYEGTNEYIIEIAG